VKRRENMYVTKNKSRKEILGEGKGIKDVGSRDTY
jgi:hypothetical protein